METKAEGIRKQSETRRKVENLMYLVDKERLTKIHRGQNPKKAVGIDGVTKEAYGRELDANLDDLLIRMKQFSYRPQPVRRVYIPKENGTKRPLGLLAYEDKLVQGAMADLLTDVYEPRFLDYSYGFRPGRNAHQAVKVINNTIMKRKVNYVLEADIKGFFDHMNHDWIMTFLSNDIADKRFLRYVKRFLKAGVLENGEELASEEGAPQGGLISALIGNVYLHYVLDWWFAAIVKPNCKGEVYYVRYADDFLLMFQYEREAQEVMKSLTGRLRYFGLEVAEEKTRILPMGKLKGTKESFDFLGFTFHNTKSRKGWYRVGVRTSNKRMKRKRMQLKAWLKTRYTRPVAETMTLLVSKLRGHNSYYGVNGNYEALKKFWWYARMETWRMLNRRSQKAKFKLEKFSLIWDAYVPKPAITVNIWN